MASSTPLIGFMRGQGEASDIPSIDQLAAMILSASSGSEMRPRRNLTPQRARRRQRGVPQETVLQEVPSGDFYYEAPVDVAVAFPAESVRPARSRAFRQGMRSRGIPTGEVAPTASDSVSRVNDAIAVIETGGLKNPYTAKNPKSSATGKYQMMPTTLKQLGYMDAKGNWTGKRGLKSWEDFKSDPAAQEAMQIENVQDIQDRLRKTGLTELIGTTVETVNGPMEITLEGLTAAAHNAGVGGLKKWLVRGGSEPYDGRPGDKNRTPASKFMAAGNATVR